MITARYPGECTCGKAISPGDRIYCEPGVPGWVCLECARTLGAPGSNGSRKPKNQKPVHQKSHKQSEWRLKTKRRP